MVYGVRETTKERFSTQYDGTSFSEVKDAKIVELFVEQCQENKYNFKMIGALFKVKAKGCKFYLLAQYTQADDKWMIDVSKLNTSDEEIMIIEDLIEHALRQLIGKKVNIYFKEKSD